MWGKCGENVGINVGINVGKSRQPLSRLDENVGVPVSDRWVPPK